MNAKVRGDAQDNDCAEATHDDFGLRKGLQVKGGRKLSIFFDNATWGVNNTP